MKRLSLVCIIILCSCVMSELKVNPSNSSPKTFPEWYSNKSIDSLYIYTYSNSSNYQENIAIEQAKHNAINQMINESIKFLNNPSLNHFQSRIDSTQIELLVKEYSEFYKTEIIPSKKRNLKIAFVSLRMPLILVKNYGNLDKPIIDGICVLSGSGEEYYSFSIYILPYDSEVFVNGRKQILNNGELDLRLKRGDYDVKIQRDGFVTLKDNFYVDQGLCLLYYKLQLDLSQFHNFDNSLTLKRHSEVSFPQRTIVNEWQDLRIQIIQAEVKQPDGEIKPIPKPSENDISFELKTYLEDEDTVLVTMKLFADNFEIENGQTNKILEIPYDSDSQPVYWKVKPLKTGSQQLKIDFWHESKYLGTVKSNTEVFESNTDFTDDITASSGKSEQKFSINPAFLNPDLSIRIRSIGDIVNPSSFEFILNSPINKLNLCSRSYIINLEGELSAWMDSQMEELESSLRDSTHRTGLHLQSLGTKIFSELMPTEVNNILYDSEEIETINIISDEPYIPWEMAYWDESYLCEKYNVTRWLSGDCAPQDIQIDELYILAVVKDFKYASDEREQLNELFRLNTNVINIDSTIEEVGNMFSKGRKSIYHLACHGEFSKWGDFSSLKLKDGNFLASWINNYKFDNNSLVFMNACKSGREDCSITNMGGWIIEFNKSGTGAVIGSQWSIEDSAAKKFAVKFYKFLSEGKTLGEATRLARSELKLSDPYYTWLSYTVYGDPNAKLNFTNR
ncbi:MAG: CHAT domain-containing protein [Candidatus Cloacimonetes bacterium]|nr:CHAT domain-containing protein [Candidatus Cloacimonadota bacterium]